MRCGECGSKNLIKKNIKGSLHPWKDFSQVELLFDQDVLTCENCGNQIMSTMDIKALDENIAKSILHKVQSAIMYLAKVYKVNQENLAIGLGCTPEYLSMLKSGKKRPGFGVFNLLMSFWKNPQLLSELAGVKIVEPQTRFIGPSVQCLIQNLNDYNHKERSSKSRQIVIYEFEPTAESSLSVNEFLPSINYIRPKTTYRYKI